MNFLSGMIATQSSPAAGIHTTFSCDTSKVQFLDARTEENM